MIILFTMTLVGCFKGQDGIILAADSRGTIGDPRGLTAINDSMVKLFKLSNYVGIVSYGQGELAAQLVQEIRNSLNETDIWFNQVFQKTRDKVRDTYGNWFRQFAMDQRPVVGLIVAGLNENEECQVYYLSSQIDFAPQLCATGYALGGVPQYATYLIHRLYNPEMSRSHLVSLAAYVISETATQDPKVGGPIRIAEISSENGYIELPRDEIIEVVRKNEEQNGRLRAFFFQGEGHGA